MQVSMSCISWNLIRQLMRGLSDPVWEELIEPGDVLYVPRGEAHDAVGEVKPSVHLTFGILAPNGIDVLNWIAPRAQNNVFAFGRISYPRISHHNSELAIPECCDAVAIGWYGEENFAFNDEPILAPCAPSYSRAQSPSDSAVPTRQVRLVTTASIRAPPMRRPFESKVASAPPRCIESCTRTRSGGNTVRQHRQVAFARTTVPLGTSFSFFGSKTSSSMCGLLLCEHGVRLSREFRPRMAASPWWRAACVKCSDAFLWCSAAFFDIWFSPFCAA